VRIRILLVEDYQPFRQFVCSLFQEQPELEIIGEVSDGLEAVQKAGELRPDLILLDIGLPTLNGIEAARRIRRVSPESRILFVSQERSADTAEEALRVGALGYVVKTHVASELLRAVETVCKGKQFISRGLSGHIVTPATSPQALEPPGYRKALPSSAPQGEELNRIHDVHFYPDDESFLAGLTVFIEGALKAGKAVIVLATESHRKSLLQRLRACGVDTAVAIEQGLYRALDAEKMLASLVVNDSLDLVRCQKATQELLAAAATAVNGDHSRIAACGEAAPLLWAQGKADAAIQFEHFWDGISRKSKIDILCGYVLKNFVREPEADIYEKICAEHSAVYR